MRIIVTIVIIVLSLVSTAWAQTPPRLRLNWTDNSANEDGFRIERGAATTGPFTQIGTVGANVLTYDDLNLAYSTQYCYRVAAYNSAGASPWSNVACAKTPAPPVTIPNAPSGLTLSAISSSTIELSWNDNADNENKQEFRWQSRTPPRSGEVGLAANQVTYRLGGLRKRTTYCGKMYAIAGVVESYPSNESCATTRR